MNLEDLVQTQNKTIDSLYNEYDSIMEEIESSSPNKENIKKLNDAGIKLFNYMDGCYSSLDAASEDDSNEKQTQLDDLSGLFSDAFESTIPYHYMIMRAFYGNEFHPSKHAFSGMQQLLVQVKNKDEIKSLKAQCVEHNLPVKGFEKKRKFRMTKTNNRIFSTIAAVISIIAMFVLIFNLDIDDSSKTKYTVLSVLIALLGGIGATLLSGALNFKIKDTTATAGYGIFIIIFCVLQGVRIF